MSKKPIIISVLVTLVLAFGVGAYFCNKGEEKNAEISPIPKTQDKENEQIYTSDWKKYTDEEYKYEISYPIEFNLTKENKVVKFHKDCLNLQIFEERMKCDLENDITISITDKTLKEFIEEYNEDFFEGSPLKRIASQEDYVLNGIPGKKLVGTTAEGAGGNDYIYVQRNGINYLISFNQYSDVNIKIVSTFNFLD